MLLAAIIRLFIILSAIILFLFFTHKLVKEQLKGLISISIGLGLIVANLFIGAIYHSPLGDLPSVRSLFFTMGITFGYVGQTLGFIFFLSGVYKLVQSLQPFLNQQYTSLVENSLVGVYVIQDGVMKYANPRLGEIFGYTVKEMIGQPVTNFVAPESHAFVTEQIQKRIKGEVNSLNYTFKAVRRDGTLIDVEVFGSRTILMGAPAIHGTLLDITERKQYESLLESKETQYRQSIELNPDAIVIHHNDKVIFCNPAAVRLFGCATEEELLNHHFSSYFHPDSKEEIAQRISLVKERQYRDQLAEYKIITTSGEPLDVEMVHTLITFQQDIAVQTIARDITERKRTRTLFYQQNQLLEQIASGEALDKSFEGIIRFVETQTRDIRCAIMLADENEENLQLASAPGLPKEMRMAFVTLPIAPGVGCCGSAAFLKENVLVSDISSDPYWKDFKDVALKYNFVACFSIPILSTNQQLLGTFAMYATTKRDPTLYEMQLSEIGVHLAAIAIEKKRKQTALLKSEERFRQLFTNISDIVFVFHLNEEKKFDALIEANEVAVQKLEYTREQLLLINLRKILTPSLYRRLSKLIHKSTFQSHWTLEDELVTKSGRLIPVEINFHFLELDDRPTILSIARDISERKEAQKALQQNEERYRTLFNDNPTAYLTLNEDGHIISVNRFGAKLFKYREGDLRDYSIFQLVYAEDLEKMKHLIHSAKKQSHRVTSAELRMVQKDDTRIWVKINVRMVKGIDSPATFLIVCDDITDRKLAEAALQESEANLKAIFNNSLQGFILLDRNGCMKAINITAFEWVRSVFGVEVGKGDCFTDSLTGRERKSFQRAFRLVLRGKTLRGERNLVGVDGNEYWFELSFCPILNMNGEVSSVCFSAIDIKDRIFAQKELRKSEERFRSLVQNSSDIISIISPRGKLLYISPSVEKILGYPPNKILGVKIEKYVLPEEIPRLAAFYEEVLKSNKVSNAPVEFHLRHADGHWVCLESIVNNMINSPSIGGIVVNSRDVTERNEVISALRVSEERFRTIFETSAIGMVLIHVDGQLMESNRSLQKMLLVSAEELKQMKLSDIVYLPEHSNLPANDLDNILSGADSFQSELRFIRSDGKILWGRFTRSLVKDSEGKPQFAVGMIEDITEQKNALKALHENEEKYRMLFNSGTDAVYVFRLTRDKVPGRFIEVNDIACQLTGFSRKELLKLSFLDICAVHDDMKRNLAELEKKRHVLYQAIHRTKFGEEIPVEINAHIFQFQGLPTILAIARDISERVHAEKAVRESAERYQGLFEGMPVGIYRTLPDGTIIDANPAFVSILGYPSREELLEKNSMEIYVDKTDRERWKTVIDEVGVVRSFEMRVRRKDGIVIWVRENSRSVLDDNGKVLYYEGTIEDITIRKKMEERLQLSESRYRDLVENSADYIFTHDQEGIILSVNRSFVEGMGLSNESQMIGQPLSVFLPEHSQETFQTYLKRIIEVGSDSGYLELITSQGEIRIVEYRNSIRSGGGQKPIVRAIARDMTEKLATQHELEAEKERLIVTLRNIGDGVLTTDVVGKVALINKVAEELTGWLDGSAIGQSLEDIFCIEDEHTGERLQNPVTKVLESGKSVQQAKAVVLTSREGTHRLITASAAPLHDKENHLIGVVLAFRDVSQLLTLEEELHKAQKLESLGILAGGIAHDFNNILTAILGNISLAKMTCKTEDALFKRLTEAEKATERAQGLTKQLLTFAKGGAPVKQTASIVEIIRETTEFALRGSHCSAHFETTENIWPVEVDKGQISQVINNLVINAMQAMPQGGTIHIQCENVDITPYQNHPKEFLENGSYVKIVIADEGVGIPKEHLSQIFDPYFTTRRKGSGLGLATSHSIVKKHGGYIFVNSVVNEGSTFTIYLPANPEARLETTPGDNAIETGKGKILIMDDEEAILEVAERMLTILGYEVTCAAEGEELIKLYREGLKTRQPYDAVIMDLTVPGGMGGKEAIRELKNIDPQLKAIVSSGYANDPVIAQYQEYGFMECIPKPYNLQTLAQVLKRVLNGEKSDP